MDSEILNPIAELGRPDSLVITRPDTYVGMERLPEFFCPDPNCLDPKRRLIFKLSGKSTPFFAHLATYQHKINPTTLLHKLAMRYFDGLTEFEIPGFTDETGKKYLTQIVKIDPTKTVFEYNELNGIRPDILITTVDGLVLAIEIFVTHESKAKKIEILTKLNLPTIEIDFSGFYKQNQDRCKDDVVFVQQSLPGLIGNLTLKKWLVRVPRCAEVTGKLWVEPPTASNNWDEVLETVFKFIGGLIILWLISKFLSWLWKRLIRG